MPKFNHVPHPYEGKPYEEVSSYRKLYTNSANVTYYDKPLLIHYGKDQWLFDHKNKRYLDLFGGITTVGLGYNNEAVNKAAMDQINKITHVPSIYLNDQMAEYAKELTEKLPSKLNNVYFVNSGSEANELAVHLARLYTRNFSLITTRQGYHGMGGTSQGLTNIGSWNHKFPKTFGFEKTIAPDSYRGQYTGDDAGTLYSNDVKETIKFCTSGKIAGFICEPIQGVGGVVEMPQNYMKKVYEYVRNAGGVTICDEVQTGFGRLGTHYWGFERHGVIPDIVTLAKSIGNGFPLAAVVTNKEIGDVLSEKLHFNTYGGNPLSCAVGRVVLKELDRLQTQKNSLERGEQFLEGLKKMKKKHECIGDLRGSGLMLGIDIVKNKHEKEPDQQHCKLLMQRLLEQGILIGRGGSYGNVLRIKPPMIITSDDVQYFLDCFQIALENHNTH